MQLLLSASLHFQTYGIPTVVTSESTRVNNQSPHVIFAVKWRSICDLTVAMMIKLQVVLTCVIIRTLPSTLIDYGENLLEC